MNNRKLIRDFVLFLLFTLAAIFIFHHILPSASSRLTNQEILVAEKTEFHYVALGDSLTEGVGDTTGQGGFVPLLAQSLTNDYGYEVDYQNFGISGNTSNQILKRMKEKQELKLALQEANLLTITVGGNDLRKVIIKNIANLKLSTFDKPAKEYGKRLESIIQVARKDNPSLPIYVVGIYNPFFLSLPELTEMQVIVDKWNTTTEETVAKYENVYFVGINDLLYRGLEGEAGISQLNQSQSNNLLFEEDQFHPNNTGYEIIKKAVLEKMNETEKSWKP
ncbi:SGNH/GDSL hydrolase family protein [Streptococcus suis]|uniref:SGNH/GDSL hydrolase family protein n=1 Tax=Streptococcus suis TaxID=1307 RepID=UPI002119AA26|nr:SGNH/GDSL hydrolase family protein [Streptococcus suis]